MKKTILFILVLIAFNGFSQELLYLPQGTGGVGSSLNNYIGIGTNQPVANFQINSNGALYTTTPTLLVRDIKDRGTIVLESQNDKPTDFVFKNNNRYSWSMTSRDSSTGYALRFYSSTNGTSFTNPVLTMKTNGLVGIGITEPTSQLDIRAAAISGGGESLVKLRITDTSDYLSFSNATLANGQFIPSIKGYHTSDNRQALWIMGSIGSNNDVGPEAVTVFDSRLPNSSIVNRPLFEWRSYTTPKMTLLANGSLGIGTKTTGNHLLAVDGSIGAREVKVEMTEWRDFVFNKAYPLPTLNEVEKHIQEKGHLKDIPSEKEVLENGISLGEMNAKLLQKIEELTLYLIDQNKKLEGQSKKIEELQQEIAKLKKQ